MSRRIAVIAVVGIVVLTIAAQAGATPVATTEEERGTYGRTFLEPINSVNFIQHGPENAPEEFRSGMAKTKMYLVSTSPDGWAAGDVHGFYSASNGAGINSNRVAYQEGWVFPDSEVLYERGYSTLTQPEGAAVTEWLLDVRENELGGRPFAVVSDIHGPLPVGAILFHDQGQDPVKLNRMHDLAERVRQNMTEVFASYVTGEGASAYSEVAREAEEVRDVVLDVHEDAIGKPNGAAYLPLDWATYGEIWEQINYTVTGSWSGWAASNAGLDAVGIAYEVNCVYPSAGGWHPPLMQLAVDNMRAILQTSLVAAAARADIDEPRFSRSLEGTVGFFEPGTRITDADGNPSPPPEGYPDHPLIPQIEQTPYDVSNTDYFRDLDAMVESPIREVEPDHLDEAVDELDSLVVADHTEMSAAQVQALRGFVERGGNLVLTDAALQLVPHLVDVPADGVEEHRGYVGYADLDTSEELAAGLPRLARQTYDPIGLGYPLLMERDNYWSGGEDSGTENSAPIWTVQREAWEAAGGVTVGTADPPDGPKDTSEGNATDKTEIGFLEKGNGRIVLFGALLPQPTEEHAHWFGLDAYTISVAGQEMLLGALTWTAPGTGTDSGDSGQDTAAPGSEGGLPATGPAVPAAAMALLLAAAAAVSTRRREPWRG